MHHSGVTRLPHFAAPFKCGLERTEHPTYPTIHCAEVKWVCPIWAIGAALHESRMADKGAKGESEAAFAKRIDPKKEHLTPEQKQFIQRVEMEQWKKNMQKLRGRNILTGLAIGAMVIGIYSYTFYSVSQERIMDEIDKEASVAQMKREKTASN